MTGNEDEKGDNRQHRAAGWTWALGCCSEDKASVHGALALPTELLEQIVFNHNSYSVPELLYLSFIQYNNYLYY